MNVSSGLNCSIAYFTGLLRHQAGLHSFTESLRVQLKNTKVKVFELTTGDTNRALG